MVNPLVSIVIIKAPMKVPFAVGSPSPNIVVLRYTDDMASMRYSSPPSGCAEAMREVIITEEKAMLNPDIIKVMNL